MRLFAAVALLVTRVALADSSDASDVVARPIVLDAQQVEAQLVVEADLETIGRPLSLAPDAWIGATSRLTVGIVHSDAALDRVTDGASLCVVAGELDCARVYHDVGADARYAVLDWLAPRVRVLVRDVSPWKPALTLGALARWQHGRLGLTIDPYVQVGLANTDRGNRAALSLPVYATIQPARRWAITLQTGYVSDLAVWSDGYDIPVALSVLARATAHVDVTAQVGFTTLLGPQNTVQEREAWLILAWRG